jgi:hypothetical protein
MEYARAILLDARGNRDRSETLRTGGSVRVADAMEALDVERERGPS